MNNMEKYKQNEHDRIVAMKDKETVIDMLLNAYDSCCNYCSVKKQCSEINPYRNMIVCKDYLLDSLYSEVEDNEVRSSD